MSLFGKKKPKRTEKVHTVPYFDMLWITGAIIIIALLLICSLIFSSSTVSYYMTELTDWLVDSGLMLVIIAFPIIYFLAFKHSDLNYHRRHKKFYLITYGGIIEVDDYLEKKDHPDGKHHVFTKHNGVYEIPMGQLFKHENSLFWCDNPAIKQLKDGIWLVQSIKGHQLTIINFLKEEMVLREEYTDDVIKASKKFMDISTNIVAAALDPVRAANYQSMPMGVKGDPYSIDMAGEHKKKVKR